MTDILEDYVNAKVQLRELSKLIFDVFQENDKFNLIKYSKIDHIKLEVDKNDVNLVWINLCMYSETAPIWAFVEKRENIFAYNNDTYAKMWYDASIKQIIRITTLKLQKFLKEFPQADHNVINILIQNYDKMESLGKSDSEIAKLCAEGYATLLDRKSDNVIHIQT